MTPRHLQNGRVGRRFHQQRPTRMRLFGSQPGCRHYSLVALGLALFFCLFSLSLEILFSPPAIAQTVIPCATPGKDGLGTSLAGIINTYYPPAAATVTLNPGTTTLQVGTPAGAPTPIAVGDLLLIMQMQDADINASNSDAYGDGIGGDVPAFPTSQPSDGASGWTALNSAGYYEFVTVTSVSGNTLGIQGTGPSNGLNYTYRNQPYNGSRGRSTYQIIRVPQYASATLTAVTALPWTGQIGGVVAIDVAGELTLGSGTVADLRGRGFRGGAGRNLSGAGSTADTDYRTLATQSTNASKGEGIAGTPRYVLDYFNPNSLDAGGNPISTITITDTGVEGYPNGSYARGAPGNAGGGSTDGRPSSNDQNTGGGGGSNGGRGGRGGRAWSSQDPTGGFGGKAFSLIDINSGERLFMGGGGGAGTTNNASRSISRTTPFTNGGQQQMPVGNGIYSSGAAGGGVAIIRTNSITGLGTIDARGANGLSTGQDGAGGGGAGGTVYVTANQGISNLSVNVQGGEGGWATFGAAHGPGGGGGGGIVVSTEPGVTIVPGGLSGGLAGETGLSGNSNPPNFDGQQGTGLAAKIVAGQSPGVQAGNQCVPNLSVTKVTSTPTVNNKPAGTTASYQIQVSNAPTRATATAVEITDSLPTGFTYATTGSINLTGGATRTTVNNPAVGSTTPSWGQFQIPPGGQISLTFTVTVASSVNPGTYQNPVTVRYLDPGRKTVNGQATVTYDPASSPNEDVTIAVAPNVLLVKRITALNGSTTTLNGDNLAAYKDTGYAYDDNFIPSVSNPNSAAYNPSDPNFDPRETNQWPTPLSASLAGGTDGGKVVAGDEIEYTIYFLSAGDSVANNVRICDYVPGFTTFISNAFNGQAPPDANGIPGSDLSVQILRNGTTNYHSGSADGDRAFYFPTGTDPSGTFSGIDCEGDGNDANGNPNGALVVDLGDLANATTNPTAAYGYIRLRVSVK
jgi:fimbrial isopeptide formation D2 family protein/uncharacterized repeat protein (TIGR01451 family)